MTEYAQNLSAGHGAAYRMLAGQVAIVTNSHGNQVVDTWAVASADPSEISSMDHTRSVNSSIFIENGMAIVSNRRKAMLTLVSDSAALRHDTLLCPCNADLYQQLGCKGFHRSCCGNFHEALAAEGIAVAHTPASLNLFMNVAVNADGSLDRRPPASVAGDHVALRAEMDLLLVLSACPQDITEINGADRTPRDVAVRIADALTETTP
ncbi:DUF1989 domain-containing protein [Agrobacterium sp. NPDC089420]|uniref:DUF1989 domain-containing protein n=1 Tax=Agrobacterium sp. NPDC089420 TaxID=3363918 RepID=UPI00385123B0